MRFKPQIQNLPPYKPAKLTRAQPAGVVKLSSNENPLGPSPLALEAMQAALNTVHRYPDAGSAALRQALAAQANLAPEAVLCTNGSDEMVFLLCLAFLGAEDEAVMAEGSFISYYLRTLEMSARAVRVPLRDYRHDLAAMAAAVTDRTRLLFICNPNNPTGTTSGAAEVDELLTQVPESVLVVLDEAYVEFSTRPDYPDAPAMLRGGRKNVIALRTFAKIHGLAGLRLGYAFADPEVVSYLDKARPTFNVNALAQAAGLAALADTDHIERSRLHANASRLFMERELRALGLEPVSGETNFVAVHVGDDAAVTAALLERGYTVNPISAWGVPGHIRISFGTEAQNAGFITALRAVLND